MVESLAADMSLCSLWALLHIHPYGEAGVAVGLGCGVGVAWGVGVAGGGGVGVGPGFGVTVGLDDGPAVGVGVGVFPWLGVPLLDGCAGRLPGAGVKDVWL